MGIFSGKDKDKGKAKNGAAAPVAAAPPAPAPRPAAKAAAAAPQPRVTAAAAKPSIPAKPAAADASRQRNAMQALGEIAMVLMRAHQFQSLSLGALASLVMPPLQAGQYIIAHGGAKDGPRRPVAVCLWAKVSAEVDRRLSTELDKPISLSPEDWKSGDIIWIVMLVGEQKVSEVMLKQLQQTAFKGQNVKLRMADDKGKTIVQTLPAQRAA